MAAQLPITISSKPRQHRTKPGWKLRSDEVEQGSLLWLGPLIETDASYRQHSHYSQPPVTCYKGPDVILAGMFNHPIIVLSRPATEPDVIYFQILTSFHGQPQVTKKRSRYAAITPAPTHPLLLLGDSAYQTLTFAGGDAMEKPTWVNIERIYKMQWRDAQGYWGADPSVRKAWKLDEASIEAALRLSRFAAGEQYVPSQQQPVLRFGRAAVPITRSQRPSLPQTIATGPIGATWPNSLHAPTVSCHVPLATEAAMRPILPYRTQETEPLLPGVHHDPEHAGNQYEGRNTFWGRIWTFVCCLGGLLRYD